MASNKVEIEIAARNTASPVIKGVADDMAAIAPAAGKAQGASDTALDSMRRGGLKASDATKSISDQLALIQKAYVGLQATQGLQAIAADLAQTADAYKNLQSRIALVTGEGQQFTSAFEAVSAIALRTNSNIESTGTLFTKLADAGKSAGLGTKQAIDQALALTETVNQAVQLSGASAGASDAAVTQLIQGLQGGALRGDEFNSVMEQSPRLARALADGLGVTTGELRKMAEAGQLSSETVIKALQGQSDAVASEFGKLPPTVGRALQNLSTSWTLYVGETDKATGASSAAASVISGLAKNLSTIAGYLIDAGQAAAGFAALRLAQHFTGIALAATASATAVVANTAAMNGAAAAGASAAVGVGRFAAILGTLKTFTLLGLITNFQDIGTAIGEGAAKLMGYKDRTNELAAAEKTAAIIAADNVAQRQRMAAATQAAIDKQFELSKAGSAAIAEFDKLTKAGDTASEAIKKIGKDFDLARIPGIQNAASVLDKLAADGKISATEFQKAWSDALKGADLAVFETQARAAFTGTAREAERLAQILDATLREAIKRTGLDFDVISGGMGKAAVSAINDTESIIKGLDRLKAMGVDTAAALTASLGQGINTADSQKAIEAVRTQIEAVRKVLGDKITDGLLDQAAQKAIALGDALDKATPGITSLREAMRALGVTSDQTFKDTASKSAAAYQAMKDSGTASIRELQDGFRRYAADAIASTGGIATEALKSEAAMRGLQVQTDSTGKSIVVAMGTGTSATQGFTQAVDESSKALARQKQEADAAAEAINKQIAELRALGEAATTVYNAPEATLKRKLDAGTLTGADQADAQAVFDAAKANLTTMQSKDAIGQFSLEGMRSITTKYNEALRILEASTKAQPKGDSDLVQFEDGSWTTKEKMKSFQSGGNVNTPASQLSDYQAQLKTAVATGQTGDAADLRDDIARLEKSPGKTYTVNLNINGQNTVVNTASDADAQALIAALQRAQLSA